MTYTTLAIAMGFSVLMMSKFIPTVYFGVLAAMAMIASLMLLPALVLLVMPYGPEKN